MGLQWISKKAYDFLNRSDEIITGKGGFTHVIVCNVTLETLHALPAGSKCSRPLIALILAASTVSWAQTPATPVAPATPENSSAIQALIKDLASEQYEQREAAQRALEKLPLNRVDILRQGEAATGDAEVKARLRTIIHSMEVELATTVPLISVNLKDAQMPEVAAALEKATGIIHRGIQPQWRSLYPASRRYVPLWDVIRQLSETAFAGCRTALGGDDCQGHYPHPEVRHRQFTRHSVFGG